MAIEVVAAVPMEIIMAIEAIVEVPMKIIMATVAVEEAEAAIHTIIIMVKARMLMTIMEAIMELMEAIMEAIMVLMRIMATKVIMENVMNVANLDIIETIVQVEPVPRQQK